MSSSSIGASPPFTRQDQGHQPSSSTQNSRSTGDRRFNTPNIVEKKKDRLSFFQRFRSYFNFGFRDRVVDEVRDIGYYPELINNSLSRGFVLSQCEWPEIINLYFAQAHNYEKERRVKKEQIEELTKGGTHKVQFRAHKALNELIDLIGQNMLSSQMKFNTRAAQCIEYIFQMKDDPRADYMRAGLIEEFNKASDSNRENLIKNLLMVRPTKTIFSFIEDFLPAEQKKVFKECVSQPKFLSSLLALAPTKDTRTIDREYGFKPEHLKAVRKAWPCHGDFFIATSCLAHLCFFDHQKERNNFKLKKEIRIGYDLEGQMYITVSVKRFDIAEVDTSKDEITLGPFPDYQSSLDLLFFNKKNFLAPLFKLETKAVALAIHNLKEWPKEIYSSAWFNPTEYLTYLFSNLFNMPRNFDRRDTTALARGLMCSLSRKEGIEKLLDILKELKTSMGMEDLFVCFFNPNSTILFDRSWNLDDIFSLFNRFLIESIEEDFDAQAYAQLKEIYEKWPDNADREDLRNINWDEMYWKDYVKGISFNSPALQRKWASYCCFFYIVGNTLRGKEQAFLKGKDYEGFKLGYYMPMGFPYYWKQIVIHNEEFARVVLDIMNRSCGDKKKEDRDEYAPGIPQPLLDWEKQMHEEAQNAISTDENI